MKTNRLSVHMLGGRLHSSIFKEPSVIVFIQISCINRKLRKLLLSPLPFFFFCLPVFFLIVISTSPSIFTPLFCGGNLIKVMQFSLVVFMVNEKRKKNVRMNKTHLWSVKCTAKVYAVISAFLLHVSMDVCVCVSVCMCVWWISSVKGSAVHWYLCSVLTAWYTRYWHVLSLSLPHTQTHTRTHAYTRIGFGIQQCVDNPVASCHSVCVCEALFFNSPLILLEWPW